MLRALLGFKKDHQPIIDSDNQQVFFYLQQAQQQRAFVDVQLPGDNTIYQSILLELDQDEKTILIDELFPNSAWVAQGQTLRISIRQAGGRSLKFQSQIQEAYRYDGAPMYVIAMPDFIDYDQRRNAFRLPVDSTLAVNVSFTGPDKQNYSGRVQDISAGGLALQLPPASDYEFAYGNSLTNVNFEFAQVNISSDLTIRNLPHKIDPESPLRIGAEFTNMPAQRAKDLELTILQIQRERLRRGEDMRERLMN